MGGLLAMALMKFGAILGLIAGGIGGGFGLGIRLISTAGLAKTAAATCISGEEVAQAELRQFATPRGIDDICRTALHELAHGLVEIATDDDYAIRTYVEALRNAGTKPCQGETVAELGEWKAKRDRQPMTDFYAENAGSHGLDFHRVASHLIHRLGIAGVELDPEDICRTKGYGVDSARVFAALQSESATTPRQASRQSWTCRNLRRLLHVSATNRKAIA